MVQNFEEQIKQQDNFKEAKIGGERRAEVTNRVQVGRGEGNSREN